MSHTNSHPKRKQLAMSDTSPKKSGKYGKLISPNTILFNGEEITFPEVIVYKMYRMHANTPGLLNDPKDIKYVYENDGPMIVLLLMNGMRDYLYYCHINGWYIYMIREWKNQNHF